MKRIRIPSFIQKMHRVIHGALIEWINHRSASKGAALAFYTLFSMAPILVLVIAFAGFFYGTQTAQKEILVQLRGLVGVQGTEAVQLILTGARNHEDGRIATIIASLLFLFGATSVIATLFAVIYKMLPRVRLSWHDVAIGALGTAGLFELGKFAIGLYIGNSGVANSFGAAGSMIALLLWVYYSAQIFFLGAEFTRQSALQMGSRKNRTAPVDAITQHVVAGNPPVD